jgi:hypothetical protein
MLKAISRTGPGASAEALNRLSPKTETFLGRNDRTSEVSTQECSLLLENEGEIFVSSKPGCWAPSGAPVRQIDEVAKITIAAQNFNWRPRALAPLGADGLMNIFILSECFSEGGHTQTSFHEK